MYKRLCRGLEIASPSLTIAVFASELLIVGHITVLCRMPFHQVILLTGYIVRIECECSP